MTESATALPARFGDLEPFARIWGELHTQNERYLLRQSSDIADLKAFHAAAGPRLEEIFQHLDAFPANHLPPAEARLFRMALGLTEVGQAVEIFGQPRIPFAPFPHQMETRWNGYDAQ